MEFNKKNNIYFLRFDPDEKIHDTLMEFVKIQNIQTGYVYAIGAVKSITLRFMKLDRTFIIKEFQEKFEITSFIGNITRKEDEPIFHFHIVLGREDFSCISGHFLDGVVEPTLEMKIITEDHEIERIFDAEIGLDLVQFN